MADANAASCSSSIAGSASTSSSRQHYDAFINHRGPDTKEGFATPLYNRLTSSGLQVFLDKPEMEVGHAILPQIEDAIKVASVHIAIFSECYAESQWCLNELVSMVKSGKPIIPVFYNVKPEHLRWTGWTDTEKDGSYAKALHHHEEKERHSAEIIQQWRKALFDVSNISGFELEAFHGDQSQLMDKLVQTVLQRVPRPLYVAKYPTGLEVKLKEFERTVLSQQQAEGREEAKVVGIWGLGGAGKTTLAKHFFNHQRSKNYTGSSFLFDVRDKTSRGNLTSLQCNLIKDLKGKDIKIDSVDEGIYKLIDNFSSDRVLIIFDDVDHIDQLNAFLPIKDVLDPNSLILVTTRDKQVLRSANISDPSIYHLRGLNQSHSRQLFCSHAFRADPLPEFENLIIGFVDACGGLPLSLKVLGALLCGENDTSYWQGLLDELSKLLPTDIESRLRISYDSLSEEEKDIFLDIACFGTGYLAYCRQPRQDSVWLHLWGRSGMVGFRNLQNKCLVEVDEDNEMIMHDHIRDMGRNIAERSMARRLWQPNINNLQDINKLLKQSSSSSEITEVRGIRMAHPWELRNASHDELGSASDEVCRMRGLKFLEAHGHFPESILNRVESPELIGLLWLYCPCPFLPPSIPMHDLRILYVRSEKLERLWDCDSQGPVQLRELVIAAPLVELPNSLGQLKHLECIHVYDSSLETFPEKFNLPELKYMRLEGCKFKRLWKSEGPLRLRWLQIDAPLVEFPRSMGKLKDLELIEAPKTYLPTDFCYLPSLHYLGLANFLLEITSDFRGMLGFQDGVHIPSYRGDFSDRNLTGANLANIRSLERVRDCNLGLEMVPNFVSNLTNLQQIDLRGCSELEELPDDLGNLTNLQHIDLSYCFNLKKLPNSFGNLCQLKHLNLTGCRNLKELPNSFGNLCQLEHLYLKGCRNLTISSETLGNIRSLVCLDLKGCVKMELLPHQVGRQQSLEFLRVGTPLLEMLPPSLGCLTSLMKLWLDGCEKLQYLPDSVELLSQLTELKIRKCRNIQYLPPAVMRMKNLKVLAVFDCPLRELPFKSPSVEFRMELLQLQELLLYRTEVSEVSFPEGVCANLQVLRIVSCEHLVEVGDLPTTLKRLDIRGCGDLRKIRGIYGVPKLEELDMRGCYNIEVEELPSCIWGLLPHRDDDDDDDDDNDDDDEEEEEEEEWMRMSFKKRKMK